MSNSTAWLKKADYFIEGNDLERDLLRYKYSSSFHNWDHKAGFHVPLGSMKKTTVVANLQNRSLFKKVAKATYALVAEKNS